METLWSISTTIREAERIPAFLATAKEIENEPWNKENQIKFQILLIKNREFLNTNFAQTYDRLSDEQINLLKNKDVQMSYQQAEDIFNAKEYLDPPMRGRQSMSPLEKLGLVSKNHGRIVLTDVGNKLLNNEIDFDDFMLEALLKLQYPNQIETEHKSWNTKPFVNILRLIKKVNELCAERGMVSKGLTKNEFGIFALSIKNYRDIDSIAQSVVKFRQKYESISAYQDKEDFKNNFIAKYLSEFNNPKKNIKEYTDNMIRYMRITKYIFIRGKYQNICIDLEPRRIIEINSILEYDDGRALDLTKEDWIKYFGTFGAYKLPFDTKEKLGEIFKQIVFDINSIEQKLNILPSVIKCPNTKEEIKKELDILRKKRTKLQNLEIKADYSTDIEKINETIEAFQNIRKLSLKPSIALEKWVNIALNIINDSLLIKPNSIVGDDNEPTFTAPAGVADIECYYENFSSICEVTMLVGRDQWYNEGQPVMRHLRNFEINNPDKECYCLFVAPKIHQDTLNTYFTSVKYEYEGKKQNIVPITIDQLIEILKTVVKFREKNIKFKHSYMLNLYKGIIGIVSDNDSVSWRTKIPEILKMWKSDTEKLIA